MNHNNGKQPLTVQCPTCKTAVEWSTDNHNRPFCSEQCRNKDFISWAHEEQIMAGSHDYDDLLSGDLITSSDV